LKNQKINNLLETNESSSSEKEVEAESDNDTVDNPPVNKRSRIATQKAISSKEQEEILEIQYLLKKYLINIRVLDIVMQLQFSKYMNTCMKTIHQIHLVI